MKTVMKVYQPEVKKEEVKEVTLELVQDGEDVLLLCGRYRVMRIKPTGLKIIGSVGDETGLPLDDKGRIKLLNS